MQNDREKEALLGAQARQALESLAAVPMQISLEDWGVLSNIILKACDKLDIMISERDRYKAVLEECREVLKTFAVVGKLIDGPFGPALFAEDGVAFSSGCAWIENGEAKTLTWGNFRRAASLIKKLDALSDNKDRAGW